jgi:HEAT repeat protein
MKRFSMLSLVLLMGAMFITTSVNATTYFAPHGGQYRGPGDIVPPNPGGGGGRTPGPRGPTTPGRGGPNTPGPAGPTTPGPSGPNTGGPAGPSFGGPTTGPRGVPIGIDLTKWQFWWEFNKDPYLNLKQAIHASLVTTGSDEFFMGGSRRSEGRDTLKPSESIIIGSVLPALKRTIDATDQRDIVSSCLIAMAKIGKDHPNFKILDEMKSRLSSRDQEIRETAALAMGISQMSEALEYLPDLAMDTFEGRKLVNRVSVDNRTRAFSCYGLGLIAYSIDNSDMKRRCYEVLRRVLEDSTKGGVVDRNIPVAAINAMRLIRPNLDNNEKDKQLLADCVDTLFTYYSKKVGQGEQMIQAHIPPAIATLVGRDGDRYNKFKEAFSKELDTRGRVREIYQSSVIALGMLVHPSEVYKNDKKYSDKILNYYKKGKDPQTRNFALMALGQIGGNYNRNNLLIAFDKGSKATAKPWAAIALGVLAYKETQAQGENAEIDDTIGNTLYNSMKEIKNDETISAIAIALGLCKFKESADVLEALLIKYKQRDELAGYLCVSLALMGNDRSMDTIRNVVKTAIRRPELLQQAAIALGKLGDKSVTTDLQRMLGDNNYNNVAKLSALAAALGYIGDKRTINPLVKMLHNESITPLSRAFAAVALGGVADKESLPWNSKIAVDMNYRAAVETLTNQVAGILDIL